MDRIPEPQLMTGDSQAEAYALADFEDAHSRMIRLFQGTFYAQSIAGRVLDLGCGPGDIACRFAATYPDVEVCGVDGSPAMLGHHAAVARRYHGIEGRVTVLHAMLPDCELPQAQYDVIISNSLLHHLDDPQVLWSSIRRFGKPGAPVFVMDLQRPDSMDELEMLVEQYTAGEPEVLRHDFAKSLGAAYRTDEVKAQLVAADLTELAVRAVTDRHLIVHGFVP